VKRVAPRTESRIAIREAERALRQQSTRLADELRSFRLRTGVSQAAVAAAAGVSRSVVSRLEEGNPEVALRTRFPGAAVLGADQRLAAYEGSPALIRDTVQAPIIERLLGERDPRRQAAVEAAVPGPGRRSIDLRLDSPGVCVLLEIESRVTSLEGIVRELHAKRQAILESWEVAADQRVYCVLVLPLTRHHRALVRDHPETIRTAFPAPSDEIRRALEDASIPWPGDGILWIRREPNGAPQATNGTNPEDPRQLRALRAPR
jgi:transcriptional regulator with XRE-family HTH domain